MQPFRIHSIGDLDLPIPETALVVDNDGSYVQACHATRTAIQNKDELNLWVRAPHHAEWLKNYFAQLRVDVEGLEETARTVLVKKWSVTIPNWVSNEDIIKQKLLNLDIKAGAGKTFEAALINTLISVDISPAIPDNSAVRELIAALTDNRYAVARKEFPILEETLKRLATTWRARARAGWLADLCEYIPENGKIAWRLLSAVAILQSYPKELLDRVLPNGQASLARKIPRDVTEYLPLEPEAREESLTQIKLIFSECEPKINSQSEFRKVVSWVSGRTAEEYRFIENILRSGRFEPTADDIRLTRETFKSSSEVRPSRLEALKYLARPAYPLLENNEKLPNSTDWIRWTTEKYAQYRNWQVKNNRYDAELEKTVCQFSDWYIDHYAAVQSDSNAALAQALNLLNANELENRLTILLMVDCLPVTFFGLIDHALKTSGFKRHDLSYRYAALPTVTDFNKAAVISGNPGRNKNTYSKILTERSEADWGGAKVHYVSTLRNLSKLTIGAEASVILFNHIEGDEILHSDVEAKNRAYEEDLARSYTQLSEALFDICDRWDGAKDRVSIILLTDHGACRALKEEMRNFASRVVSKLFNDEKYRFASMTSEQANEIPENLWDTGYRFTEPFSRDTTTHFLPRGHNTVRKTGAVGGYAHGGVAPEEVIVPMARYALLSTEWKRPFVRCLNLKMSANGQKAQFYIQRVVNVEVEIQNPNSVPLQPTALELLSPDARVKGARLCNIAPESTGILSIDLYFQKTAQNAENLELQIRYTISGEEYEKNLVFSAEFMSAMSDGFSLKNL